MDSITRGGKTFEFDIPEQPKEKEPNHFGFQIFDAVTWAQMSRSEALGLWTRMDTLKRRIEANSGHPDAPKARRRIDALHNSFLEAQARFLKWEASIHHLWKHATIPEIATEAADTMLHALPTDETLPPLWHHPLGSQEGAPPTCPMTTTSLQFSTREMMRRYRKQSG